MQVSTSVMFRILTAVRTQFKKGITMKKTVLSSILILTSFSALADSPPNLPTSSPVNPAADNIHWVDTGGEYNLDVNPPVFTASFNGVTDIEAAFNNARRQEEIKLGLAANTIGTLDLPAQAVWDAMSDNAKALYILNDERVDRAGMTAGVIGLPLQGVESHIDDIAENYGDILHDGDFTGHTHDGTPFERIARDPYIGDTPTCHEFMARAENLAYFSAYSTQPIGATSIPLPLERAIYNWIYADASSSWGHREAALLQDKDLSNNNLLYGYANNYGPATSEGFLGIHRRGSTEYSPFGSSSFPYSYGVEVVLNIFDPVSDAVATSNNCQYHVTVSTDDLQNLQAAPSAAIVKTKVLPNNQWVQLSLPLIPAGSNTVQDLLGTYIGGTYDTDWVVYAFDNGINDYTKLTLGSKLKRGVGYWVKQITGSDITVTFAGTKTHVNTSSACTSANGCIEIPVETANQWNMLGNPFDTAVNVNDIRVVTSSGTCSTGCTLDQASTANIIHNQLWAYNGTGYDQLDTAATLSSWRGYWLATLAGAAGVNPKVLIPID